MRIDINADVGESYGLYKIGEDHELFQSITSANIACGLHAGDYNVMFSSVKLAAEREVAVGAHPGYPDIQGFGRRNIEMTPSEIYNCVVYQIGALKAFCDVNGISLQHVKPHGALYNKGASDAQTAKAIAEATYDAAPNAILFGLAGSQLLKQAEIAGLKTAAEAFADRTYTEDGYLTPRSKAQSVLTDRNLILEQVKNIVIHKKVRTLSGSWISLNAETICFHGDGKNSAAITRFIRAELEKEGISVLSAGDMK
ncbi:MAG: 5-oxoprolinase subunit PxpA [Cytobacillus gottheilii]|uniref:LamB/YcsF family protein n=1 Tax=Cytobacillus gottheilii TaxID=859144 RepID=UPI0034639DDE